MNRRNFFSFIGTCAGAAATPAVAVAAIATTEPRKPPRDQGYSVLRLNETYLKSDDNGFTFNETSSKNVDLSVGQDGHLWVKIAGEWKRVIAE